VNLSDSFYVPTADKTASVMLLSELGDEVSSKKELDSTTEYIRPFFGRSNRNDGRELKRHASRNTDLSQKQLICIWISDTQSLRSGRERGGRGFPAVSGRTVDLDIELVVCRCGTLTKTCIMTPPVHSKLTVNLSYYCCPCRAVMQSGKGLTVQNSRPRLSISSGRQKRRKRQADIVRTIYGHPRAHTGSCHGKMLQSSSSIEVVSAAAAAGRQAGRRFIVIASLHPSHGMAVRE